MISNLEVLDDDTAKAFGQKFDVKLVLDAMIAFVKAVAAEIRASAPHAPMTFRIIGDGDRVFPADDDAYARLRAECGRDVLHWDASEFCAVFKLGTLAIKLYPLGVEGLQRYGAAEPMLSTETTWRDLDPTPIIRFMPSTGGSPFLEERGVDLVRSLVKLHAPPGATMTYDGLPIMRFPHHTFGSGLGDLRIRLVTIPVEP